LHPLLTKVFILTNNLKIGGAEKQSILLAKALQKDYNTNLVVYYGSQVDSKLKDLTSKYGLSVTWLQGSHLRKIFLLYKLFRRNRHAAIFSYLATTNLLNGLIGILTGVPLRIGGIRSSKIKFQKLFLQRLLHNYLLTYSVFNNYAGMEELGKRGFNQKKSIVIHNGIEITRPPKKFKNRPSRIRIISVGRFVLIKDFYTAIDSFSLLTNLIRTETLNFNITLTLIGYGEQETKIRTYIKNKNLEESINVVINPPNITEYYAQSDIYLSTSLYEGLSNSIMEAMEYSLPVVATDVGDNKYLVKQGVTGFLTNVKAKEEIATRLYQLVIDYSLLQKMGNAGYDHLKENFSEGILQHKYLELLRIHINAKKA